LIFHGLNSPLLSSFSFFVGFDGTPLIAELNAQIGYHACAIGVADFHGGPTVLGNYITQYKSFNPSTKFLSNKYACVFKSIVEYVGIILGVR
jgi:hypothetical protein